MTAAMLANRVGTPRLRRNAGNWLQMMATNRAKSIGEITDEAARMPRITMTIAARTRMRRAPGAKPDWSTGGVYGRTAEPTLAATMTPDDSGFVHVAWLS